MGEQMDRAKAFIDALPDGDVVIVTASNEIARWLAKASVSGAVRHLRAGARSSAS
jgi:hypothetical protein